MFHSILSSTLSWHAHRMILNRRNYDKGNLSMENNETIVASELVVEPTEQPKIDVKAFKASADTIAKQLGQCMICNTPITEEYTLMYQKIAGQPTAIAVLCNDCCMLRLAKPRKQEASNEN